MKNVTKHRGRLVIRKRLHNSVNGNPRFSIFISRHDRDGRLLWRPVPPMPSLGIAGFTGPLSVRCMMERYPHLDSEAATQLCKPLNAGMESTACLTKVDSSIAYEIEAYDGMYVEADIGTHYGIRQLDDLKMILGMPRWGGEQH
jgi:hypothetical protein